MMKWIRILAFAAATVATLTVIPAVQAHAEFVSSTPAPGSVVPTVPARLTIVFSEGLARGTDISVTGPNGAVVSAGDLAIQGQQASIALRDAGTGVYTVNWKTVSSEDGDEASDSFQFGVGAPGTVQPRAAPRTGAGIPTSAGGGWELGAAAVVLLLLGSLIVRRTARYHPAQ
jgi:methionine-rich copper-binding protein CopC